MADPGPGTSRLSLPASSRRDAGRGRVRAVFLATLVLALACSCTPAEIKPPETFYYVTPKITYLRDGPGYAGSVLGQLYEGDRVEKLAANQSGWWQVRSPRSGQAGWIQGNLLSLNPVAVHYSYVTPNTVELRECPGNDCPSLRLLYRGDRVQQVQQNEEGWTRVLVAQDRSLGWLPTDAIADQVQPVKAPEPGKTYLYVAVKSLRLREQPSPDARIVKTLEFNEQVQKLEQNDRGWLKVRQPASGAVGWVSRAYLGSLPSRTPKHLGKARKPRKKTPPQKPAEAPVEPEFM